MAVNARAVLKRLFDLFLSTAGLVLLSPVFLVLGALVKLGDGGPIVFRQERIGQGGRVFSILKFRSMVAGAERLGPILTRDRDPRITRVGRFLRRTKLDELPQLWNVFCGQMSFVGPRPEVQCYVEKYTPAQRQVLALRPGITDLATLEFRNEEELLGSAADTERFYLEVCLPRKIELNLAYARRANLWTDLLIILCTVWALAPGGYGHGVGRPAQPCRRLLQ